MDLERIRFVTQRFNDLQGFRRLVPAGLLLLSGALLISSPGWPFLLPLAGACLLFLGAKRYYTHAFGETEPLAAEPFAELSPLILAGGPMPRPGPVIPAVPRLLLIGGIACAVFVVFQLLLWPPWVTIDSEVVYWSGDPAMTRVMFIQMAYGLGGVFFLGTWWLRGQRLSQGYHLGMGLLLAALSALGPWFVPEAVHVRTALLLCGSSLVLAGLLDHWQLVRGLK